MCDSDDNLLSALPDTFYKFHADVADSKQMQKFMADSLSALDGVDVLINNAGIGGPQGPIETLPIDEWERCVAVGVCGLFYTTRVAAPMMKKQKAGCIINISSNAGRYGLPDRTPYVASKWAIIGLTKTLAMELGPYGIRVNAICPGSVEGARIDRVINNDAIARDISSKQARAEYLKQISLRRFTKASEIAAMALFLASDNGAGISGQAIGIDGNTETLGRIE